MRFKNLLLAFILGLGLTVAHATETRVGSMGGVGMFIRDNSNIYIFPGAINFYKKQVIAELRYKSAPNNYTLGAILPMGNSIVGFSLNTPLFLRIPNGNWSNVSLKNTLDIFWGMPLSGSKLGINFKMAMDRYSESAGSNEIKETAHYFALTAGLSSVSYDFGAQIELPSVGYEVGSVSDKWGGFGFGVNGRYFIGLGNSKQVSLVPTGTFFYRSTSKEYDSGVTGMKVATVDYGFIKFAGGTGIQYENNGNLFILGLEAFGYESMSEKDENSESSNSIMILPGIYVGSEINITPWLVGRLGAKKIFAKASSSQKYSNQPETSGSGYVTSYNMTFGIGVHIGNLQIDATFNEGLLFDGPNFISGTGEPIAHRLSISYSY